MKLPAIALMIAALALPGAALARDHYGGDHDRGGGYGLEGPRDGGSRDYRDDRPTRPDPGRAFGGGGRDQRGYSGRGGYGEAESYGAEGRGRSDWNGFGDRRGGANRWRRGQMFPPAYRGGVVNDYYRYHLRRPPPGYYWYRSGDDYILAGLVSGLIFEVVPSDGY